MKSKLNKITILSVALGSIFLGGCAATQEAQHNITTQNVKIKRLYEHSNKIVSANAAATNTTNQNSNFGFIHQNWVNPDPLPADMQQKLPHFFNEKVSVTAPGNVSVVEIISDLETSTGISFNVDQDVYNTSKSLATVLNATTTQQTPQNGQNTQKGAVNLSNLNYNPVLVSDFVFSGSLKEALNLLASKANISWSYKNGQINVFRYETKTYNIAALAGNTQTTSSIDLQGNTSSSVATGGTSSSSQAPSSGKSTSDVQRTAKLATWSEVQSYLLSQMSPNGKLAILESTGVVTVTDTPEVQERVKKAIKSLNKILSQQIYLDVNIYSVDIAKSDNTGVNWNLAWSGTQNKFTMTSPAGAFSDANNTAVAPNSFTAGVISGPFAGTSATIQALSKLGKTSLVNQFSVTTLNGQPTPVASNIQQTYLAQVSVTGGANGSGNSTSLTPGTVMTGITLNVTPKVENDNKLLIEYSMNLSDLLMMNQSPNSGGNVIQLPVTDIKSVLQRAELKSGQTLVLSGFKQQTSKIDNSGVGSPNNLLLGGNRTGAVDSKYLVITVTPYLAQNN